MGGVDREWKERVYFTGSIWLEDEENILVVGMDVSARLSASRASSNVPALELGVFDQRFRHLRVTTFLDHQYVPRRRRPL